MKTKAADLIGPALDWAVAKANGWVDFPTDSGGAWRYWFYDAEKAPFCEFGEKARFKPSTDWAVGGPIIEREGINVEWWHMPKEWHACLNERLRYDSKGDFIEGSDFHLSGPTPPRSSHPCAATWQARSVTRLMCRRSCCDRYCHLHHLACRNGNPSVPEPGGIPDLHLMDDDLVIPIGTVCTLSTLHLKQRNPHHLWPKYNGMKVTVNAPLHGNDDNRHLGMYVVRFNDNTFGNCSEEELQGAVPALNQTL